MVTAGALLFAFLYNLLVYFYKLLSCTLCVFPIILKVIYVVRHVAHSNSRLQWKPHSPSLFTLES
jgi:hypothetical protein